MAGVCNLARIWERKKLCHSFGNAVDLLLAVCMLVQEMADMLFHLELGPVTMVTRQIDILSLTLQLLPFNVHYPSSIDPP